jgi:uncharacterized protein (TIGR02757 family)
LKNSKAQVKNVLEKLYDKYNRRELIRPDPLQFVYHYSKPADMEVAALLAASLAYGRVQQIEKNLNDLFGRMGTSPYAFVMNFDKAGRQKLNSFKHRFTTGRDISDLLSVLKKVLRQKGSIEKHLPALSRFCDSLYEIYSEQNGRKVSRGMKYLLASPVRGSACKRLNLFLRWMVRSDDVDTGLWKRIDKAKLIVPVDVHMGRLCRILGFHDRKIISLSTAVKITECFAQIEPADPVKYDFALSRIGILGNCTGRRRSGCELCELFKFCSRR